MIVNVWHETCERTIPYENVEEVHFDYCTENFTIIFHDGHSEEISLIDLESIKMSNDVVYEVSKNESSKLNKRSKPIKN